MQSFIDDKQGFDLIISLGTFDYRAVDKFFSLGVLTFTTHNKQLCAVAVPNTNWGCFKHPLVYGLGLMI